MHLVPLDAGAQLALLVPEREGKDPAARDALQGQLLVHALVQLVEDARHADEQRRLERLQDWVRSTTRAAASFETCMGDMPCRAIKQIDGHVCHVLAPFPCHKKQRKGRSLCTDKYERLTSQCFMAAFGKGLTCRSSWTPSILPRQYPMRAP